VTHPARPSRVDRLGLVLATERRLIGLSLLRIAVAGVMLLYLLGQWSQRHLIWGPDGIFPTWLFARELPEMRAPSLFATDSPPVFEVVYHLAIIMAVLYLTGWKTVPVGIAFVGLSWSLLRRTELGMTGGDALLLLILPWLLLTNVSTYFSADSGWRGIGSAWRPPPRPWRALVHNVGLFGIMLQLSTMYLFAGLHKLTGEPWLDGTVAAAILRIDRFALPALSPLLYDNDLLSRATTYWTLIFEITSPFLLGFPATRWLVALQSVMFHGGIGVVMGLVTFALEVTMLMLVIFPDTSYYALASWLSRAVRDRRAAVYNSEQPAGISSTKIPSPGKSGES
jgi:HTTM domain